MSNRATRREMFDNLRWYGRLLYRTGALRAYARTEFSGPFRYEVVPWHPLAILSYLVTLSITPIIAMCCPMSLKGVIKELTEEYTRRVDKARFPVKI